MGIARKLVVAAGLALMASPMLAGCSQDKHVFHSTVAQPTTVLVTEPFKKEVLWSQDVPVQHKLVVDFDREGEAPALTAPNRPATSMHWKLFRDGEHEPVMERTERLPGTPVALQVALRPAPEYPGITPLPGSSTFRPPPVRDRAATADDQGDTGTPTGPTYGTDQRPEAESRAADPAPTDNALDVQDR